MTRREPAWALLIDLDGVLRRWDPAVTAEVEQRFGVAPGTVLETLFEWPRLVAATTGQISDAEWHAQAARALADRLGGDPAVAQSLIDEWQAYRGAIDEQVLGFV
ncbi:MAG: haloacid dehalogenase, partial [Dactylosporangium sp.]|nr:haloacid dehalogenase [Dactylosporangium sp.]